ncbi:semaphorin-4E-like isoform X4 [Synchiropus splendidus]|nr:semaphorin-4E-like isoform X4 [Synchiropus splendidus]
MTPLQPFFLFLLLLPPLASTLEPRRFLPYDSDNTHTFHEEGVFDYSTMLLREDLDLLVVGASGMLYALHLNDISKKNDSVKWDVTPQQVLKCEDPRFHVATYCRNQIKTLLKTQDDRMLVCGTNALAPRCDHMSYVDGKLTLEGKEESGEFKCPSDPSESSASLMIGDDVYSATESVFSRSPPNFVRTLENKDTFTDPKFVAMEMMPESENSDTGDDDKIYLFFSEKDVEYETYKPILSRVARVCKGDLGGVRSFHQRWTSFVKARLQCPDPGSKRPYIIQDSYRWCDPQQDWKSCLFFTVFTSSPGSAVCVYSVTDISREFSEGQFMTRVGIKWQPYNDSLPVPRPGSCIDYAARKAGINQSLLLPPETLELMKKNLIMEDIQPVGGKASLVTQRGEFTRIIVDQVQTTDGDSHHVMFIGTKKGTILKAVNYDGEMFIIQEVQVFKTPEPIKILKFSSVRRQIYAGSDSGVVQVSASSCGRSLSCVDCVLARDPYCGWDQAAGRCTALSAAPSLLLQSVKEGNACLCPKTDVFVFCLDAFHRAFHEEGVFNYSTMLLREDLDLLVVGASGMLYALHLDDISKKNDSVEWNVTPEQVTNCVWKGKNGAIDCRNQIKTLLKRQDNRMYVCGTNAFNPKCDYMAYEDGKLTLENKRESGVGRVPYDPFERSTAIMLENDLYSATSVNFRATQKVLVRRSQTLMRTDDRRSWFYDPDFVSLEMIPESENSDTGDDDKIYLFFTETAVEYDSYKDVLVSRVARVCKGDRGGARTLQDKWTSFIKARLECPVLDSKLPYVIQDSYRWCDPQQDWKSCLFFAVFTSQTPPTDMSAVCVYQVPDVSRVFAEGQFMTEEVVGGIDLKWFKHHKELPVPRPGACIDNAARKAGFVQSLDLPDSTLMFIQKHPLIGDPVRPVGQKALLFIKGVNFTRIIVDQVQSADGDSHYVMFIGTERGTIMKAVNYDGEMIIIEEVQVFKRSEPVKILKFSNVTRQIYAGSDSGVVQVSASSCGRSLSCVDCVLARDPYCGWDQAAGRCTALSAAPSLLLQSVKEGNASLCPKTEVPTEKKSLAAPGYLKLLCSSESKLATIRWEKDHSPLVSSPRRLELEDGLFILNVSKSDAGLYRCLSVGRSREDEYITVIAQYNVTMEEETREAQVEPFNYPVLAQQIGLVLAVCAFYGLLVWNFYKGHLRVPCKCKRQRHRVDQESHVCTNSKDQPENEEN